MENMFPVGVSEKEFFSDLVKGKTIVDNGIKDYFILAFPKSFDGIKEIGNTRLKDLVDVFGEEYIKFFRFGAMFDCGDHGLSKDEYQTFSIRPITKSDWKRLRGTVSYFPKDTWVCDWRDGTGFTYLMPFIQNYDTGEIIWLFYNRMYNRKLKQDDNNKRRPAPVYYMQSVFERLPDYFECSLAICKYKGVDICIPLAVNTAKDTFKNRERDENGVKKHIVHSVKSYRRLDSEKIVERHLRGRSDIVIKGEHIVISSPIEFSQERLMKKIILKGDPEIKGEYSGPFGLSKNI